MSRSADAANDQMPKLQSRQPLTALAGVAAGQASRVAVADVAADCRGLSWAAVMPRPLMGRTEGTGAVTSPGFVRPCRNRNPARGP